MQISELLAEYVEIYVPTLIDQKTIISRCRTLLTILSGEVEDLNYEKLINYRSVREQQGISPASVNKDLTTLDSAIDWGRRYQLLPDGFNVRIPTVSVAGSKRVISGEDIRSLAGDAIDIRLSAFIQLAFLTGARPSALKTLRSSQITGSVVDLTGEVKPGILTRRKNRATIPLTPDIKSIIERIRKYYGNTEYVFPGKNGFGYWKNIDRAFAALARKNGFDATSHTLRHSTATALIEQGTDLLTVSRFLGHRSVATTERVYLHARPESLSAGVKSLGQFFKG